VKIKQSRKVTRRIAASLSGELNLPFTFSNALVYLVREIANLGREKSLVQILPSKSVGMGCGNVVTMLKFIHSENLEYKKLTKAA